MSRYGWVFLIWDAIIEVDKCRINAFNLDFISFNQIFIKLRLFIWRFKKNGDEYTVISSSILLQIDIYKSLTRLQLIALISFSINGNAAWIHNTKNSRKKKPGTSFKKSRENPDWHPFYVCTTSISMVKYILKRSQFAEYKCRQS